MLENKWKDIAPEVPHDFHEKFEETLECIEKDDKKHRIIFRTTVTNQNDKLVTDGKARVMKR